MSFLMPKPKMPAPLPVARPRSMSLIADEVLRRRGSSANQRTGAGGAESSTSGRKQLMGS